MSRHKKDQDVVEIKDPSVDEIPIDESEQDDATPEEVMDDLSDDSITIELTTTRTLSSMMVPAGSIDPMFNNELTKEVRLQEGTTMQVKIPYNQESWMQYYSSLSSLGVIYKVLE